MKEEVKPQANRLVRGLAVFVGFNGLCILSWPFIGLYHMLFTGTRVLMGPAGMFGCVLIGALMVKAPFQVFREYSKTALAGVILGTAISVALDGLMLMALLGGLAQPGD